MSANTRTIRVRHARRWWQRARGLIAHPPPAQGAGMYFARAAAVHGFGMAHALDIVFLDAHDRVLKCARLPRWGMRACPGARAVLELREGEIARLALARGMRLRCIETEDIF